jgi:fibronectin type 3 domain-containing protein
MILRQLWPIRGRSPSLLGVLRLVVSLLLLGCTSCAMDEVPFLGATPREELPPVSAQVSVDLSAPRDLEARSGELRKVPLTWTPLLAGDVAGYLVERSDDGEQFERIASVAGRFSSTFVDEGSARGADDELADGAAYHYRVRAVDSRGRAAREPSAASVATTAGPPMPPLELRTFNRLPRQVALTWRASDDASVVGYEVSRSPSAGGPFEPITRIEGRFVTHHVDAGLGDLRVLYYQVAAFNEYGVIGGGSEPAVAVTKPEPLPPSGLRVSDQWLGANRIAWEPNVEPDVTGYRVLRYREAKAGSEMVAELGPDHTLADDTQVGAGEAVSYAVVAFDDDGLESLPAEPVSVISEDYGLVAEVHEGAVRLRWQARPDEGFDSARVYREGVLGLQEIGRVPTEEFVDRDVESGRRYRYVVTLERDEGPAAPPSDPVEILVPAGPPEEPASRLGAR